MATIPLFGEPHLRAICDVFGDTTEGLTNSEIDAILQECNLEALSRGRDGRVIVMEAKRERLFKVLRLRQDQDRCGNNIVAFMKAAMAPVRYVGSPEVFRARRERLNEVLAFVGYQVGEDGDVRPVPAVRTLTEVQQRAKRLRDELQRRGVHPDVVSFCREELLAEDFFHAVLEATKSVADKIRAKTGLSADGNELVDRALSHGKGRLPLLAFNTLRTPSERDEHRGLANLAMGLFSAFRNVTAHEPRIHWPIGEQDALDLLTLASLLHRRLDEAVFTSRQATGP